MSSSKNPKAIKIVGIGGGTGLSTLLRGLKKFVGNEVSSLSAIVAVTDDGGSSGRLRDEFQMPPPGDVRNCMVALSEDEMLMSRLFRHRFEGSGPLGGHSFGNLFLAALSEITGDFAEAVRLSSEVLASKGHIYPASLTDVRLSAELEHGSVIYGETKIATCGTEIKKLFLEPGDALPHPDALKAVESADLITVGPGSLFTSLLPPLLVRGLSEEIMRSKAAKIFICNLMTQPGETTGMSARRHLEVVRDHVPHFNFDKILVNSTQISARQRLKYQSEGAVQIGVHGSMDSEYIDDTKVIHSDLLMEGELVRHDPRKLAEIVLACSADTI